ncbi:glycosyltransferase family 2 protein [Neisseriaceae bacterium B1]
MKSLADLLTVALIVKNEARNLAACLESVAPLCCPIVVIDSGSEDETLEIAAQYGAKVQVHSDWQGFGVQRNRAHALIETPWVLWLDADERLSEKTRQDLLFRLPETKSDGKTLFSINRLSIAYGHKIYHGGWYPDKIVRVYPVAHTRYNDDLVHESVIVPNGANILELKGNVLHETYRDLNQHLSKIQLYTLAWAKQRQFQKSANLALILPRSAMAFFKVYILKRGFLDGAAGLMIAAMASIYTFLKYAQLWLLNQQQDKFK